LDKEGLYDFVNKKREMFLIQYALNVKQEEIKKLEGMALVSFYGIKEVLNTFINLNVHKTID
jgi:hypothetical protein